jgi:hypothetical protein
MCRRSPPACDRRHIRQPGPAARFTAVLPRGSGGDTGGARRNRQGLGDTAEDRCSGGPETSGVVAGNRGVRSGRWRCRSGARSPTACDPSASLPRPAPSRPERAWPFTYPACASAGVPEPAPSCTLYPSRGKLAALVPSGPLTVRAVVRSGVVEGQGELLAGQPGCARSLCRAVFWRGQACSDEPALQAGDGAVLEDQLAAVARDLPGRSEGGCCVTARRDTLELRPPPGSDGQRQLVERGGDPVVGVPLGSVPGRRQQLLQYR